MTPDRTKEHGLFAARALLPEGWRPNVRFALRGGRIAAITCDATPEAQDERHACVVPGMPNLHSHAFQRAMAGLAEVRGPSDDGFWTWREVMYRFLDRLTPDDVAAIAGLAYVEMLEAGFTRVGEFHYLHHDRDGTAYGDRAAMARAIAEAAATSGIGLTLLPVFYAWSGFGAQDPLPAQRRFVNDLDGFARLRADAHVAISELPGAVLGIAPHSLRAASPREIIALEAMSGDGPIHIHIAEQVREVDDCVAWSGQRPVAWLLDHVAVDGRWCLVHATHVDDAERRAMTVSGAVVGLCPVTEANLGDGIFPARDFVADGGLWGVGSDSNVAIDLAEELRLLEYGQRLVTRSRNVLARHPGEATGAALFKQALTGGARALGAAAELRVGDWFEAIALDTAHVAAIGRDDDALLDAFVFTGGRCMIDRVWRAGRCVVVDGRHVDRSTVARRYGDVLRRLLA